MVRWASLEFVLVMLLLLLLVIVFDWFCMIYTFHYTFPGQENAGRIRALKAETLPTENGIAFERKRQKAMKENEEEKETLEQLRRVGEALQKEADRKAMEQSQHAQVAAGAPSSVNGAQDTTTTTKKKKKEKKHVQLPADQRCAGDTATPEGDTAKTGTGSKGTEVQQDKKDKKEKKDKKDKDKKEKKDHSKKDNSDKKDIIHKTDNTDKKDKKDNPDKMAKPASATTKAGDVKPEGSSATSATSSGAKRGLDEKVTESTDKRQKQAAMTEVKDKCKTKEADKSKVNKTEDVEKTTQTKPEVKDKCKTKEAAKSKVDKTEDVEKTKQTKQDCPKVTPVETKEGNGRRAGGQKHDDQAGSGKVKKGDGQEGQALGKKVPDACLPPQQNTKPKEQVAKANNDKGTLAKDHTGSPAGETAAPEGDTAKTGTGSKGTEVQQDKKDKKEKKDKKDKDKKEKKDHSKKDNSDKKDITHKTDNTDKKDKKDNPDKMAKPASATTKAGDVKPEGSSATSATSSGAKRGLDEKVTESTDKRQKQAAMTEVKDKCKTKEPEKSKVDKTEDVEKTKQTKPEVKDECKTKEAEKSKVDKTEDVEKTKQTKQDRPKVTPVETNEGNGRDDQVIEKVAAGQEHGAKQMQDVDTKKRNMGTNGVQQVTKAAKKGDGKGSDASREAPIHIVCFASVVYFQNGVAIVETSLL